MKTKKFKLGKMQRKWLMALKSGKYKQCKRKLHNDKTGGYCCLGVANDCLILGESNITALYNTYDILGMFDQDGKILGGYTFPKGSREYLYLTDMNDRGATHAKIAQFIEENPEKVFTKSV